MNAVPEAVTLTIVIADDHPLYRTALREALRPKFPAARIVELDSYDALRDELKSGAAPDLVLLDLHMPGVHGYSSVLFLRGEFPAIPVVVISGAADPLVVRRVLDFGVSGFIPKTAEPATICSALQTVLDGGVYVPPMAAQTQQDQKEQEFARKIASLSPQQFRVLMMMAEGRLNKQIAYDLQVAEATVKAHVTVVLRKLGIVRRTQAVALAQRLLQAEPVPLSVTELPAGNEAISDD